MFSESQKLDSTNMRGNGWVGEKAAQSGKGPVV